MKYKASELKQSSNHNNRTKMWIGLMLQEQHRDGFPMLQEQVETKFVSRTYRINPNLR
jgi:hypothetical protein